MKHLPCGLYTIVIALCGMSSASFAAGEGKDVVFSLPIIAFNSSTTGHVEFNLGMEAGLAIEGSYINTHDRVSEETTEETGETLLVRGGRSFSAHIARYTEGHRLAGFFWSLGLGHQTMDIDWKVAPEESDPDVDFSLVNDVGLLTHQATLQGVTGYGRLGYRYVAQDYPLVAEIYFGLTHFQAGVKDVGIDEVDVEETAYAPLTTEEKDRLKRRFKTSVTPAISVGMAF